MKSVVGLFAEFTPAHEAVAALAEHGYDATDISLVAHDVARERAESVTHEETEDPAKASGMLGLLDGFGEIELPGVGPLIAAGPLLGMLTGAVAGEAEDGAGGLVKALQQAGVPAREARGHADAIGSGASLVVVRTDDSFADQVAAALVARGASTTLSDLDIAL